MNMQNILITGGAGFIGSRLALKLVSKGYKVRVLDNLSKQIHGDSAEESVLYQSIQGKVDFIQGNICNKAVWTRALADIDAVVHLAAETGTGQSMYEINRYTDVNVGGTAGLLDYITNNKHAVKKIIVASSRAVYGEGKYYCKDHGVVYPFPRKPEDMTGGDFEVKCPVCNKPVFMLPTDEQSGIHPVSVYGITKQIQEDLILTCCKSLDIPALSLRYQNVYGPGQSLKNPYTGILSIFSTRLITNKSINIFEDGQESRDFIYVDDAVDATVAGIERNLHDWLTVNVGTGIATGVLAVANTLRTLFGSGSGLYISGNYRLGDIRHNVADITMLKEKLQYHPAVHFNEGIERFAAWVQEQNIDTSMDLYGESLSEMRTKGLYKSMAAS
jgi:dTDP-L-rhamnose 4-epimerase